MGEVGVVVVGGGLPALRPQTPGRDVVGGSAELALKPAGELGVGTLLVDSLLGHVPDIVGGVLLHVPESVNTALICKLLSIIKQRTCI
jgi:hypothetical protein